MRELTIAANMIALARNRKGANKRSAMLRMIMPFLSKETGDRLASAIDARDSAHFAKEWDKVKQEIVSRLSIHHKKNAEKHLHAHPKIKSTHVKHAKPKHAKHMGHKKHKATGADVSTFAREDGTSVCVRTYGAPEKIRLSINGNDVFEGAAPPEPCQSEDLAPSQGGNMVKGSMATIQVDTGLTGQTYVVSDPQIVEMIKLVCERLLMDADPCPIPEKVCEPNVVNKPFDYNADILELHSRLVTCKSL